MGVGEGQIDRKGRGDRDWQGEGTVREGGLKKGGGGEVRPRAEGEKAGRAPPGGGGVREGGVEDKSRSDRKHVVRWTIKRARDSAGRSPVGHG